MRLIEAANHLSVNVRTIRQWCQEGKLTRTIVNNSKSLVDDEEVFAIKRRMMEIPEGMKKCNICNDIKKSEEFSYNRSYCILCYPQYQKEKRLNISREYYKKKYQKNREGFLRKLKLTTHKLTEEQLTQMEKEADGKCQISGLERKLYIDHDHSDEEAHHI